MSKVLRSFLVAAIFIISSSSTSFAISKVSARYNVMEFTASSAQPHGSYDKIGIGGYEISYPNSFIQQAEFDADIMYDNTMSFGLNYGRLINDNIVYNVGFSYTDVQIGDDIKGLYDSIPTYHIHWMKLRMFNIDFNWNYYFMPPVKETFAPYAGVGLQTGLLSASGAVFTSESDFVMSTAFNLGADITVWKASDNMSLLKLSSVNSYQFYASDSRPKYMTIGFGLKYFMRP